MSKDAFVDPAQGVPLCLNHSNKPSLPSSRLSLFDISHLLPHILFSSRGSSLQRPTTWRFSNEPIFTLLAAAAAASPVVLFYRVSVGL